MSTQIKQISPILVISRRDRLTIPQIPAHSGPAIQSLYDSLKQFNIASAPDSRMIYIYHDCTGDPAVEFDLEICLPIASDPGVRPALPVEIKSTTPFRCVASDYTGPMTGIGQAWMQLVTWIHGSPHEPTGQSREIYKKWVAFDSAENVTELQQGIE